MKTDTELTDAELVARCRGGEKGAFAGLVSRHRPRLARLLRAMLDSPAEAEDVLQETLLQAYLGLERLRDPARFGTWSYAIALNLARMRLRANPTQMVSLEALAAQAGLADGQPRPEQVVESREVLARLQRAIAGLPAAEREAVWRVYLEGLSHQETAEALGATVGAVKVRVHRGRQRLQAALQPEFGQSSRRALVEVPMIAVTVHDVFAPLVEDVLRALGDEAQPVVSFLNSLPEARKEAVLQELGPSTHRVVLLKEKDGDRALPIWIGPNEGDDVVRQLRHESTKRPITFDLTKTLLELGGVHLQQVVVSRLHETVFYATLFVITNGQGAPAEVDGRPSDAISLALRLGVPIFVAPEVMDQAGIRPAADGAYDVVGDNPDQSCEWLPSPFKLAWRSLV
ncbi:MAG: DUF151 domain-containing protein [Chloroflexi bacterium]|nr:DUF151 domain-containing protein [Chloroflexota bacterium]MCI0732119.1 DUF151 domain-containing protein [Chloroflexota bacterium]